MVEIKTPAATHTAENIDELLVRITTVAGKGHGNIFF
jgi:hypothetical protein